MFSSDFIIFSFRKAGQYLLTRIWSSGKSFFAILFPSLSFIILLRKPSWPECSIRVWSFLFSRPQISFGLTDSSTDSFVFLDTVGRTDRKRCNAFEIRRIASMDGRRTCYWASKHGTEIESGKHYITNTSRWVSIPCLVWVSAVSRAITVNGNFQYLSNRTQWIITVINIIDRNAINSTANTYLYTSVNIDGRNEQDIDAFNKNPYNNRTVDPAFYCFSITRAERMCVWT